MAASTSCWELYDPSGAIARRRLRAGRADARLRRRLHDSRLRQRRQREHRHLRHEPRLRLRDRRRACAEPITCGETIARHRCRRRERHVHVPVGRGREGQHHGAGHGRRDGDVLGALRPRGHPDCERVRAGPNALAESGPVHDPRLRQHRRQDRALRHESDVRLRHCRRAAPKPIGCGQPLVDATRSHRSARAGPTVRVGRRRDGEHHLAADERPHRTRAGSSTTPKASP